MDWNYITEFNEALKNLFLCNMNLIDTHTHLYSEEFKNDRDEIILRAIENGISRFYLPAIDSTYTQSMLEVKKAFPKEIFLMAGLHPCSVKENFKEELKKTETFLKENDVAGIGESGLDFYWDKTFTNQQIESLHHHIEWALQYKKPLILHTRNSIPEAIEIIRQYKGTGLTGIFHCFSGDTNQAKEIIDLNFYLGIGGVVTFKNSGLDKVVEEIDLSHIVLETDSPYLAPVPYRGKRNESSYLKLIAEKLSVIKETTVDEIAKVTTENALKIFS